MAFDPNLDKKLFSETAELETTKLTVSIHSYNDGIKKMQISRENLDPTSGQYKFSKLGRMIQEEAEAIFPLFEKALKHMAEEPKKEE